MELMKFASPTGCGRFKSISETPVGDSAEFCSQSGRQDRRHTTVDDVIIVHFELDVSNRFQNPVWSSQQERG